MFEYKKIGGKHYVRFNGKPLQLPKFSAAILKVDRVYDKDRKMYQLASVKELRRLQELLGADSSAVKLAPPPLVKRSAKSLKKFVNIGSTMKLPLFQYQKEVVGLALEKKCALLVLPCGAGKTPIALDIYLEAKQQGFIKRQGLVIVKSSLKKQWSKEVEKFTDLKARVLKTEAEMTGRDVDKVVRLMKQRERIERKQDAADKVAEIDEKIAAITKHAQDMFYSQFKDVDLLICNYETLLDEPVKTELHKCKLDFIMADEVHYIKSPTAKRSLAVQEFADIPFRFGATATPVTKNPEDIFSIFRLIDPTVFPNLKEFGNTYLLRKGRWGRVVGAKKQNLPKLHNLINPYLIIKSEEEVSKQLPKQFVIPRYCDFEPAQQEMSDKLMAELDDLHMKEDALYAKLGDVDPRTNEDLLAIEANIMARQTFAQELAITEELLRQSDSKMANAYLTGCKSNKMEVMADLVSEIVDSGEKVCIFSRYQRLQDIIVDYLKKAKVETEFARVSGKENANARYHEVYEKFAVKDSCHVLLCSDAGAEGLNLSTCKYIIEMEFAESYTLQKQRHGRIKRADSIHNQCIVYQLITNGSYDEIQQKVVAKKQSFDVDIIKGGC